MLKNKMMEAECRPSPLLKETSTYKKIITHFLAATILAVACPGDDIVALIAATNLHSSSDPNQNAKTQNTINSILVLMWLDKRNGDSCGEPVPTPEEWKDMDPEEPAKNQA